MTMAASIEQAAQLSYSQISIAWLAGNLKSALGTYITAANVIFQDSVPNDRPVGNWLVPLYAVQTRTPGPALITAQSYFNETVGYVYQMCYAAHFAATDSRITAGQRTALLAAWNAAFGT